MSIPGRVVRTMGVGEDLGLLTGSVPNDSKPRLHSSDRAVGVCFVLQLWWAIRCDARPKEVPLFLALSIACKYHCVDIMGRTFRVVSSHGMYSVHAVSSDTASCVTSHVLCVSLSHPEARPRESAKSGSALG